MGQSPTRNFSRLVPICKVGVGGLGEHLGKTRGAGEEGVFEGREGTEVKREDRLSAGRSRQGILRD